jgi:hypothetical protein
MSLRSLFDSVANWKLFVLIRDSKYGMPALLSLHLVALTVLLATVLVLNLRLSGIGMRDLSPSWLARRLRPLKLGAILLAILSGFIVFTGRPQEYLGSRPFRLKMALLLVAIVAELVIVGRRAASPSAVQPGLVNRLVAGLSLILWFGVGWAGRAIAFVP